MAVLPDSYEGNVDGRSIAMPASAADDLDRDPVLRRAGNAS